ncbi:MAG: hypothetical protein HYV09_33595, partial [Deltaproteobacteria bacterium]|nr:hypothetical protein [Deltaproteobacteria bacterium]
QAGRVGFVVDPFSSASTCSQLRAAPVAWSVGTGPPPVAQARTWLLRTGWLRHGPITPPPSGTY